MELNCSQTICRFIALNASIMIVVISNSAVSAANLEVVESFWTSTQKNADLQNVRHPRVEADRADGTAVFAVTFVNRSRQDLTTIRATTSLPSGVRPSTNGNSPAKAIYPGVVRAGDTFTVLYPIEFDSTFDNRNYRLNLQVEFSQVQQNRTFNESHEAVFRLTGRTNLEVEVDGAVEPGLSSKTVFRVTNRGTAKARGVRLTLPGTTSGGPSSPAATVTIVGSRTLETAALEPGQSIELATSLFAGQTAAGSIQAIPASLIYQNACNELISSVTSVGVSVYPEQQHGFLDVLPEANFLMAQAGRVSELKFNLVNRSKQELTEIAIAATPILSSTVTTESLKIMGQHRWTISAIEPAQSQPVSLSVFTSRELISRAASVRFSVQYELLGQPHSQSFEHSLYVDGEVNVRLRDPSITMIGGIPNLTGNLLNEGAGTAQFSSMEIVECEGWNPQKSSALYLGDIAENSPLPISIPLDQSSDVAAGSYEFRMRLEYKNALKEDRSTDLTTKVFYTPEVKPVTSDSEANPASRVPPYLGWLMVGLVIGFLGGMLLFRRGRKQELLRVIQQSKHDGMTSLDEALEKNSTRAPG